MKYLKTQFTQQYYRLWELGLLIPDPKNSSVYSIKFRKNDLYQYSRVTLKASSVSDALERACYAVSHTSSFWRPEDIDLHAVYDEEENLLWIDEAFLNLVQKKNEFRGMDRRSFLTLFGSTSAAILYGLLPRSASGQLIPFGMMNRSTSNTNEQIYTTSGSYSWVAPTGVSSVCVVCIGGGGGAGAGGGGGGGLGYKNNIAVTAGSSYTVVVGAAGISNLTAYNQTADSGGTSYFISTGTVAGYGGAGTSSGPGGASNVSGGNGGNYIGDSGGSGGSGGTGYSGYSTSPGGGGAGGYGGSGGIGANADNSRVSSNPGYNGSYGGGGGGSSRSMASPGGSGGGTSLYGCSSSAGGVGGTGSGNGGTVGTGPFFGAGGGAYTESGGASTGSGTTGAVRIIWGAGKSFPSNAT